MINRNSNGKSLRKRNSFFILVRGIYFRRIFEITRRDDRTHRNGDAIFDLGEGFLRAEGAVGEEGRPGWRRQPELRGWAGALRALRALQRLQFLHPPPQRAENHTENQRSINLIDRTINRRGEEALSASRTPPPNLFSFPEAFRWHASRFRSAALIFFLATILERFSRVLRRPNDKQLRIQRVVLGKLKSLRRE